VTCPRRLRLALRRPPLDPAPPREAEESTAPGARARAPHAPPPARGRIVTWVDRAQVQLERLFARSA
jgi:hypothetical protein